MKTTMNKIIALSFLTLVACTPKKHTQNKIWKLNPLLSHISIITTKNNSISEVSEFKKINGSINESNYLTIELDMNSLETNIPIRNERINKYLFETNLYPTAQIHTQLKPEDLIAGVHEISFDVDLHGVSGMLNAEFRVFEQNNHKVISLHKPLIVNANMFGFEQGITTLKNLAKLQNINLTVPVQLTLTFE